MTTALFTPRSVPIVIFSLYLLSFVATILTAFLFKGQYPNKEPFVLELPPYRFPTFKQILLRAWCEVRNFLRWSYRFIIFGVVAIWALNNLPPDVSPGSSATFSGMIGEITQPILASLGINSQLAIALIFGFIAKEIVLGGLAVIYGQQDDGALAGTIANQIDWVQSYSFMLLTLLYVPCRFNGRRPQKRIEELEICLASCRLADRFSLGEQFYFLPKCKSFRILIDLPFSSSTPITKKIYNKT
ncbi:MAG: nucleoside recognition domain-containing protein [Heteroscytonema crispum UTEX LB 1556]